MEDLSSKKRGRDNSSDQLELDSQEVKKLREDLLDFFDDSDLCTTSQDLDSFMKSFEEEISSPKPLPVPVVDLTSESDESRPDLGYLLEASDDELGLPPSTTTDTKSCVVEPELVRVDSESQGLSELLGFGEQICEFDSLEFGIGEGTGYSNNGEYVALDGLFDYSDLGFGSSEFSWRSETLPAL
ncbi:hypothetical protein LguiB_025105 [Lonicera macranthoides]